MALELGDNYFELFELAQRFDVDIDVLTGRYRELQRALHPDKFASSTDQERRLSVQMTARVNDAYQTLKDPRNRAKYLLTLHGLGDQLQQVTVRDLEFLDEQMTLRESLAEIREASDPHHRLTEFLVALQAREKRYIDAFRQCFDVADEASMAGALDAALKMQFVRRLQQEAEALEEELY